MTDDETSRKRQMEDLLKQVGMIAGTMGRAIVPVWRHDGVGGRPLVGSAFFAMRGARRLLLTALHNFELNEGCNLYTTIGGADYLLNTMQHHCSKRDDLWWCDIEDDGPLPASLRQIALPKLTFDEAEQCRYGLGVVLCGFPGNLPGQTFPFKMLSMSAAMATGPLQIGLGIDEPVVYDIGGLQLVNHNGSAAMLRPNVPGMSGGPAFGWIFECGSSGEFTMHYFLQGMITSWRKSAEYVVACNAGRIAERVDATTSK